MMSEVEQFYQWHENNGEIPIREVNNKKDPNSDIEKLWITWSKTSGTSR
jgi:hypothetical protein